MLRKVNLLLPLLLPVTCFALAPLADWYQVKATPGVLVYAVVLPIIGAVAGVFIARKSTLHSIATTLLITCSLAPFAMVVGVSLVRCSTGLFMGLYPYSWPLWLQIYQALAGFYDQTMSFEGLTISKSLAFWLVFIVSAASLLLAITAGVHLRRLYPGIKISNAFSVGVAGLVIASLPVLHVVFHLPDPVSYIRWWPYEPSLYRAEGVLYTAPAFVGSVVFAWGATKQATTWQAILRQSRISMLLLLIALALGYGINAVDYSVGLGSEISRNLFDIVNRTVPLMLLVLSAVFLFLREPHAKPVLRNLAVPSLFVIGLMATFLFTVYITVHSSNVVSVVVDIVMVLLLLCLAMAAGLFCQLLLKSLLPCFILLYLYVYKAVTWPLPHYETPRLDLEEPKSEPYHRSARFYIYYFVNLAFHSFWLLALFYDQLRVSPPGSAGVHEVKYGLFFYVSKGAWWMTEYTGYFTAGTSVENVILVLLITTAIVTLLLAAEFYGFKINGKTISPLMFLKFSGYGLLIVFLARVLFTAKGAQLGVEIAPGLLLVFLLLAGFSLSLPLLVDTMVEKAPTQATQWRGSRLLSRYFQDKRTKQSLPAD